MKAFVPIEKQSKKAQRAYHKKQRRTWGALSPVTRRPPDPKGYQRKKIRSGCQEESGADFFYGHSAFLADCLMAAKPRVIMKFDAMDGAYLPLIESKTLRSVFCTSSRFFIFFEHMISPITAM